MTTPNTSSPRLPDLSPPVGSTAEAALRVQDAMQALGRAFGEAMLPAAQQTLAAMQALGRATNSYEQYMATLSWRERVRWWLFAYVEERLTKLRRVDTDGALTGPVWLHHGVKVLVSCALAWLALALGHPRGLTITGAALVGGFGYYTVLELWYLLARGWSKAAKVEYDRHTRLEHAADWLVDGALAMVVVAGGLMADGTPVAGLLVLAGCLVAWFIPLPDSRP